MSSSAAATSLGLLLNCCGTASKEISAALEAQPA